MPGMIRPDGLVAGSCGPLSRSPEPGSPEPFRGVWGGEHLVGYGFLAPEGNRQGHWRFSPQDCFRATKIYAWGWKGETATISSLRFGSDEQLDPDHPLPADLFASWVSPKQFLEIYGGVDDPVAGQHRVLCKHLPGQPCFAVTLDFPTLPIGGTFEVAWTGPLTAFFVCGRELLPAEGRKGSQGGQGSQGEQESEGQPGQPGRPGEEKKGVGDLKTILQQMPNVGPRDPPRPIPRIHRLSTTASEKVLMHSSPPGFPGCPSSLRAGTKDTTV